MASEPALNRRRNEPQWGTRALRRSTDLWWTLDAPEQPHSAPECHSPGRSRLAHAVARGCPPRPALGHSAAHAHKAQSGRAHRLGFGPIGSVRDRSRSADSTGFFDLLARGSASGFGQGISVDGSVGETLGILQVTDSMRVLFVGLIIPWSQVRVLAGPPPLHVYIVLWHCGQGTAHCPESHGPRRTIWDSWGYGSGLRDWCTLA